MDIAADRTIDVVNKKSIEINHPGHLKSRFTVVLTIAANGYRLPTYFILRKLKKTPKVEITYQHYYQRVRFWIYESEHYARLHQSCYFAIYKKW
jgi:hypothetical protein